MSRIVFGSANHWTSPYQVGSHAWARLFAGHDWDVAYLSDPMTPWHGFLGRNKERNAERMDLYRREGESFENGKLRAWVPYSLIAPQNMSGFRSRWILDHWNKFSVPCIQRRMKEWGFKSPEILWLDSVRHAGWGKRLKPKFTVLRIADWTAGFAATPPSILELERELIQEVDLVITTAQALEERIKDIRGEKPLQTIRNGVDLSLWSRSFDLPKEYADIPEPRVVYVGALDEWFDLDSLFKMAKALPKLSFVMIGQQRKKFENGESPSNIHWLGSRPRNVVPAYVQHAQVGIIPFKRNDLIECVCPLKLYEYMACGVPVVAARWEELERMKSPAALASNPDEWIEMVAAALAKKEGLSKTLKDYAYANNWQERWLDWEKYIK